MKPIKFTSILLCFLMVAAVFAGCDTPEESKGDVNSKDTTSQNAENISETVSEEISEEVLEEVSEEVSQALDFVIVDYRDTRGFSDLAIDAFYTDDEYIYFFGCDGMHEYVIVEYADGTTQNVAEAFQAGNITIADLDRFDIGYVKMPVD